MEAIDCITREIQNQHQLIGDLEIALDAGDQAERIKEMISEYRQSISGLLVSIEALNGSPEVDCYLLKQQAH